MLAREARIEFGCGVYLLQSYPRHIKQTNFNELFIVFFPCRFSDNNDDNDDNERKKKRNEKCLLLKQCEIELLTFK